MGEVIQRRAGRVVLLDDRDRILLLQGIDPTRGDTAWWFTPGGGAEGDESTIEAARRELLEETGLDFPHLIGPLWNRRAEFDFLNNRYEQYEEFYLARVSAHELVDDAWTDLERTAVIGHRWFSLDELEDLTDQVYPQMLLELLQRLQDEGVPPVMLEIH